MIPVMLWAGVAPEFVSSHVDHSVVNSVPIGSLFRPLHVVCRSIQSPSERFGQCLNRSDGQLAASILVESDESYLHSKSIKASYRFTENHGCFSTG
jgi:hypothetical protein